MRRKWFLGLMVVISVGALGTGCGRRIEAADYELRPGPAPLGAVAVTLAVVVPAGTDRGRLAAIRGELRDGYAAAKLVRLGFFDDRAAADRPQGPDAPSPPAAWWDHYVAQYNLNRSTGYEWFGRVHADRTERWQ